MKPKMLLSYLKELDPRWKNINEAQVVTTNRVLIQGMNTELSRFKKKIEEVRRIMSELPAKNE